MNATFDAMLGAMGFARVNTKPCSDCKHSAVLRTSDELLACYYWSSFTKKDGPVHCKKWVAK